MYAAATKACWVLKATVYDCSWLDDSSVLAQPGPESKTLASSSANKWRRMNKKSTQRIPLDRDSLELKI